MDAKDAFLIRGILEDRAAIAALGRVEAEQGRLKPEAVSLKVASAALSLLAYSDEETFDALLSLALTLPPPPRTAAPGHS